MEKDYDRIIQKHNIRHLCHFTAIQNFKSICDKGILSRKDLERLKINYVCTDINRYDNQIDKISLSISFPNYKMFYKKRCDIKNHWVIILLKPELLCDKDLESFFFKNNASSSQMISKYKYDSEYFKSPEAFESMFSKSNILKHSSYTINSQAEILVKGSIGIKYIQMIIVKDYTDKEVLESICRNFNLNVDIMINPSYFINPINIWK
jgi:hypothetical protein